MEDIFGFVQSIKILIASGEIDIADVGIPDPVLWPC